MVSYQGYNVNVLSFSTDGVRVGYPVSVGNEGKLINASVSNDFIGVCNSYRNDIAGVQMSGYVELNYTGTAPSYGYNHLITAASGNVSVSTDATKKSYLVLKVDTENKVVGFLL